MQFYNRWMILPFRWDCPVKKPNREREESVSGPILLKISSIPPYAYVDNESKKVLGDRGLSIRRNLDELSVFFPKVMQAMSVTIAFSLSHGLVPCLSRSLLHDPSAGTSIISQDAR